MSKGIKFRDHNNEPIYPCPYFPIGYIYLSSTNINPTTYFGGTWEQIKDRFLLTAGNTYSAGNTGGESNHTLSESEMPSHSHGLVYAYGTGSAYGMVWYNGAYQGPYYPDGLGVVKPTGGSQPHNNMPPYLVVYAWKRIS